MNDLDIFLNAPKDASPAELAAYLDQACGNDAALRARVDALFEADRATRAIADRPPLTASEKANGSVDDEQSSEKTGDLIGPYKLLQKIGEGGFGMVFMAEQTQPVKRRVALKIIKQGMDTRQVIARFEAERQALAMMEHPNIARVLDAGATATGRPYFVMELVRGTPITTFCDEQSLDTNQRLALFQDVCSAVGHAHQKGIIHRDLKPSNILVGLDGDTPIVKVIDFGIAKATQLQLTDKTLFTRFEQFIGTPLYISPEQASLSPIDIDTRSDIYSLGVLLYELLTGKPPLDKEELMKAGFDEMRRLIREQEPPKPSTRLSTATDAEQITIAKARHTEPQKLGSFIRGDLDWIVLKALEKDRRRRYDTTAALRRDIDHFLNDEIVTATPPSAVYKFQKFARRNKGALVGGSAVALALVVGTIVSTTQWFRAEDAAEQAELEGAEAKKARAAEQEQRTIAEQRLRESARSDRATAKDLGSHGRKLDALAYLARSCRNDPQAIDAFHASIDLLRDWDQARAVSELEQPLGGRLTFIEEGKIAWSPDGKFLAMCGEAPELGSAQFIARVWNSATGAVVHSFVPESPDETVAAIQFDPAGNCLVLVCPEHPEPDAPVRVWDAGAGAYRATLAGASQWEVRTFRPAAFSSDGSLALFEERPVARDDGSEAPRRIGIWNTTDGSKIASLDVVDEVRTARFSPGATRVITTRNDESIVWDVATSRQVASAKTTETNADGSLAVIDGTIWDTGENRERYALEGASIPALSNPAGSAKTSVVGYVGGRMFESKPTGEFSPDGLRFAQFASKLPGYGVWDTETGRLLRRIPAGVSEGVELEPQFSRDGLLLATYDRGQTKIWDTLSGELLGTLPVEGAHFSPDGRRILTPDHQIWTWSTRGFDRPLPHGYHVITPDGKLVSAVGDFIRVSSVDEGAELARWDTSSPVQEIYSDSISPDGTLLATTHENQTVQVWEIEIGALVHRWDVARIFNGKSAFYLPLFSPDGTAVVVWFNLPLKKGPDGKWTGSEDTLLYDLKTGELRGELRAVSLEPSFSPDGTSLAVVEVERERVAVYATENLDVLQEYPLEDYQVCRKLGFRPDGSDPLMLTDAGALLDMESGNPIVTPTPGTDAKDFSFSPDGKQIAFSIGRSDLLRVYDLASKEFIGEVPRSDWPAPKEEKWHLDKNRLTLQSMSGAAMPPWWSEFLTLAGGRHFNDEGELANLPVATARSIERDLLTTIEEEDSPAAAAARWWLAPVDEKGIHVGSPLSATGFADQLIVPGATTADLRQAYRLDPGHPLIHLALAGINPSEAQARSLADYSKQRLPDDPELQRRAQALQADFDLHLAQLSARHGDWQQALQRLDALKLPEPVEFSLLLGKATLLAHRAADDPGHLDQYQALCAELLARTDETSPRLERYKTAMTCLLLPPPAGADIPPEVLQHAAAGREHSIGLAAYRSGDPNKALESLSKFRGTAVSAMANFDLGDRESAEEELRAAETSLEERLEKGDLGTTWLSVLRDQILLDEARRRIAPES